MICEYAGCDGAGPCKGKVSVYGAMTAYHFEGVKNSPEDPNKDLTLCEDHWEEYHAHWKSMWDDYYSIIREGLQAGQLQLQRQQHDDNQPSAQDLFDDFKSKIRFE